MKINQELVNTIIQRGKDSEWGLEEPEKSVDINMHHPKNFDALAQILVGAYHSKYCLVSVFAAAMKEIHERTLKEK